MQLPRRVLARNPSYDPRLRAAMVLAVNGDGDEAESIGAQLESANPEHTLINAVLLPMLKGAVALGRGEPAAAIDALARLRVNFTLRARRH
jgi:hypothetical protein